MYRCLLAASNTSRIVTIFTRADKARLTAVDKAIKAQRDKKANECDFDVQKDYHKACLECWK